MVFCGNMHQAGVFTQGYDRYTGESLELVDRRLGCFSSCLVWHILKLSDSMLFVMAIDNLAYCFAPLTTCVCFVYLLRFIFSNSECVFSSFYVFTQCDLDPKFTGNHYVTYVRITDRL